MTTTNTPNNIFTARTSATLFSEIGPGKQPLEQQSAFRRPLSGQENLSFTQQRSSSQNLLISQTPQKFMQNGYQQQSSNVRPTISTDSSSGM
jgi:hypothetical protein